MDVPGFIILKFRWHTPTLATCERCQLKFLTPTEIEDPHAATTYLLAKYHEHRCNPVPLAKKPPVAVGKQNIYEKQK
jgi:hypothetical protein